MIFMVRHGETDWNLYKRIQGKTDIELNSNGVSQAKVIAEKLVEANIDVIVASPLKRAKKTAEIIGERIKCPVIYEDDLIERNYGEFEGRPREDFDFYGFWSYDKNLNGNGVENIRDFFDRVYRVLDKIKLKYNGKNVLLVTHGGVVRVVNCYFNEDIDKNDALASITLGNCEVMVLEK